MKALLDAPGPAPWYLNQPANDLSTHKLTLTWVRDPKSGPTKLQDEKQRIYALASMYCYIWKFSPEYFIVWYHKESQQGQRAGSLRFDLYNAALQKPISNLDSALEFVNTKQRSFISEEPPLAEYEIDSDRAPGSYDVNFPTPFVSSPELFILVAEPSWDPQLRLWIIDPTNQKLQIVSQDWFNTGSYDFGYQWVTKITRDFESNCLIGDGIRIRPFVLSEDGSRFLKWLDL